MSKIGGMTWTKDSITTLCLKPSDTNFKISLWKVENLPLVTVNCICGGAGRGFQEGQLISLYSVLMHTLACSTSYINHAIIK